MRWHVLVSVVGLIEGGQTTGWRAAMIEKTCTSGLRVLGAAKTDAVRVGLRVHCEAERGVAELDDGAVEVAAANHVRV